MEAELIEKEKELSHVQKELNQHVDRLRLFESEKRIKNERLKFLNDKVNSLNESIEQDKEINNTTAQGIQTLEIEKQEAENLYLELKNKLEQLHQEYEDQKNNTQMY